MPNLCRAVASEPVQAFYSVSEVVGQLGSSGLAEMIRSACAKEGKTAEVAEIEMKRLPALDATVGDREIAARQDLIGDNGILFFFSLLYLVPEDPTNVTVKTTASPNSSKAKATPTQSFFSPTPTNRRRTNPTSSIPSAWTSSAGQSRSTSVGGPETHPTIGHCLRSISSSLQVCSPISF